MVFVSIYFLVGYIKKYHNDYYKQAGLRKALCLIVGVLLVSILIINMLGLKISMFSNHVLFLAKTCNPVIICLVILTFGFALQRNTYSKAINGISSLTLFMYLIHENLFFRGLTRPHLWQFISTNIDANMVVQTLTLAIVIFVISLVAAMVYKVTICKFVNRISDYVYSRISNQFYCIVRKLIIK